MNKPEPFNREIAYKFLRELEKSGNISVAVKSVGISRPTLYRWREKSKWLKSEMKIAQEIGKEEIIDFAQGKHIQKIQEGYWPAIQFELDRRHLEYMPPRIRLERERFSDKTELEAAYALLDNFARDLVKNTEIPKLLDQNQATNPEEVADDSEES